MYGADYVSISVHLVGALAAGGVIGLERSYHGRPAGFRTHTLVCVASSLLMLVTLYQWSWVPDFAPDTVRTDPTRMAQGIMTGIGFLGAGVIYKEGLTVRGLTTAASLWMTAAVGILFGIGFYFPAVFATVITLVILSLFRYVEIKMPTQFYAHYHVSFDRNGIIKENELRGMVTAHGFSIANMSYRITDEGKTFEYRMVIRTTEQKDMSRLAETLSADSRVKEFRISPAGD